jgi:hypothetical protein
LQTNTYVFANTTAYASYRFFTTANNGTNKQFQISELQLFDIAGAGRDGGTSDAADSGGNDAGSTPDVSIDGGPADAPSSDVSAGDAASPDVGTDAGIVDTGAEIVGDDATSSSDASDGTPD